MRRLPAHFVLAAVALVLPAAAAEPRTFCNPLNLDYGWTGRDQRHGADPVIVLHGGKYLLFSTWDVPGFRVSDDLITWHTVLFPDDILPLATTGGKGYCAPAVASHDGWLYFMNMVQAKGVTRSPILRTRDPLSGKWEPCGEVKRIGDPALFFDDDGRAWMYHGLDQPTKVFELDTNTFTEIPGSERLLRPAITNVNDYYGGYERGRRELTDEVDTRAWLDRFQKTACQEAAWMTKHQGRYYLQYATPGTVCDWYCDTVMTGPSPTGPFQHEPWAPVSFKVGGFIGSAGHSCVFADKHGNLWRATTMWIGVRDAFERRIGLFPVGFDDQGRMFTDTILGDHPQVLPDGPRPAGRSPLAGWWLQSARATSTASSSLAHHPPALASDENVRTWWSAATGQPGEWLQLDLGRVTELRAAQVNFAEQDSDPKHDGDFPQYRLLVSTDGKTWSPALDRSGNQDARVHDYAAWSKPVRARFVKIENVHAIAGGKFALRELRLFGPGDSAPPSAVPAGTVTRHDDDRNATIAWSAVPDADGYLVRWGPAPDQLWQCLQVAGGPTSNVVFHALNRGVRYHWRIDAYNHNGPRPGTPFQE